MLQWLSPTHVHVAILARLNELFKILQLKGMRLVGTIIGLSDVQCIGGANLKCLIKQRRQKRETKIHKRVSLLVIRIQIKSKIYTNMQLLDHLKL